MLHYENYQNKNIRNRNYNDFFIKNYRTIYIGIDKLEELNKIVKKLNEDGVKVKDAYHVASAIIAECDFFMTVDKRLLKVVSEEIKIINPAEFVKKMEELK